MNSVLQWYRMNTGETGSTGMTGTTGMTGATGLYAGISHALALSLKENNMYSFKEKSRPLDLPTLDLRLVDALTLRDSKQGSIRNEFHTKFGAFLGVNFSEEKLCADLGHMQNLLTAYLDEEKILRKNRQPVPTLEEWSKLNSHLWIAENHSAPHEGVFWYELQSIASGELVGVLQISQINKSKETRELLTLSGHPIMTLPRHSTLSYAEYWGKVLIELLDNPFISLDDENRSWVFDEWILPTNEPARYVSRPGLTFGADIIDAASVGTIVERENVTREFAPKNIRKTVRKS